LKTIVRKQLKGIQAMETKMKARMRKKTAMTTMTVTVKVWTKNMKMIARVEKRRPRISNPDF
jgi:hypothetical protein